MAEAYQDKLNFFGQLNPVVPETSKWTLAKYKWLMHGGDVWVNNQIQVIEKSMMKERRCPKVSRKVAKSDIKES